MQIHHYFNAEQGGYACGLPANSNALSTPYVEEVTCIDCLRNLAKANRAKDKDMRCENCAYSSKEFLRESYRTGYTVCHYAPPIPIRLGDVADVGIFPVVEEGCWCFKFTART